jgi:hypothetical protein
VLLVGQVSESSGYCGSAALKFRLRLVTYYIGPRQVNDVLLFPHEAGTGPRG